MLKALKKAQRTLSCPACRRWLTYLPFEGFTLHYQCDEHGVLTFTPLVPADDEREGSGGLNMKSFHSAHGAA